MKFKVLKSINDDFLINQVLELDLLRIEKYVCLFLWRNNWYQLPNPHDSVCMKTSQQVVKIFRSALHNHIPSLITFDPFFTNKDLKWQE